MDLVLKSVDYYIAFTYMKQRRCAIPIDRSYCNYWNTFSEPRVIIVRCSLLDIRQTFEDWELLLANDGSTDFSLDLVKNMKDPRVVVVDDGTH